MRSFNRRVRLVTCTGLWVLSSVRNINLWCLGRLFRSPTDYSSLIIGLREAATGRAHINVIRKKRRDAWVLLDNRR